MYDLHFIKESSLKVYINLKIINWINFQSFHKVNRKTKNVKIEYILVTLDQIVQNIIFYFYVTFINNKH